MPRYQLRVGSDTIKPHNGGSSPLVCRLPVGGSRCRIRTRRGVGGGARQPGPVCLMLLYPECMHSVGRDPMATALPSEPISVWPRPKQDKPQASRQTMHTLFPCHYLISFLDKLSTTSSNGCTVRQNYLDEPRVGETWLILHTCIRQTPAGRVEQSIDCS